tara:strand:- start:1689 stop:1937 length:249 start_codon:yes stop_codon:yes gene_type:complete
MPTDPKKKKATRIAGENTTKARKVKRKSGLGSKYLVNLREDTAEMYTTDDIRVRKRHLDKGGFVKGGDYKVKRTKEGTYKLK